MSSIRQLLRMYAQGKGKKQISTLTQDGQKDAVAKQLSDVLNTALRKSDDEKELQNIQNIYGLVYGSKASDSIDQLIIKKFPHGETAVITDMRSLYSAKIDTLIIKKLVKLKEKYPNTDFSSGLAGLNYSWYFFSFLMRCANQLDTVNFNQYIGEVSELKLLADLNHAMADQILTKNGDHILAKGYVENALKAINGLRKQKPGQITVRDWEDELQALYVPYANTYAAVLYKAGKKSEALEVQKTIIAIDASRPKVNEQYVKYLLDNGNDTAALRSAESFIKAGKSNKAIDTLFKVLYVRMQPNAENVEQYFASLSGNGIKNKYLELKEKMIDLAPKYFKLEDIHGKEVALEALKGKIVVLDFWAHWCKPCKEGFEGMQLAQNKYRDDPNVVFLFINTAEKAKLDARKRQTIDYLKSHNYNFQVLFDEPIKQDGDYKVLMDYDVGAIPAKFVLDKKGRIRYKSIGYNGNVQELVQEVSMMIELVKENDH